MKGLKTTESFLAVYDELADAIFRHCYFRVYDRERAKDLTQDTFTKTWEYLVRGNAIDNPKAFLYRVANNLIIDYSRRKKDSSLDELVEQGFDTGTDEHKAILAAADAHSAVKLIGRLDEKYRQVVLMRYVDDLKPKEIALATGETENVVSVRIHRGMEQLREILSEKNG